MHCMRQRFQPAYSRTYRERCVRKGAWVVVRPAPEFGYRQFRVVKRHRDEVTLEGGAVVQVDDIVGVWQSWGWGNRDVFLWI